MDAPTITVVKDGGFFGHPQSDMGNVGYKPMEMPGTKTRIIRVVDYDPRWPVTFAALKKVIETTLGNSLVPPQL